MPLGLFRTESARRTRAVCFPENYDFFCRIFRATVSCLAAALIRSMWIVSRRPLRMAQGSPGCALHLGQRRVAGLMGISLGSCGKEEA